MAPGLSGEERPTPRQITDRSFTTSFRGYDTQEVRAFLHELSVLVEDLDRDLADTRDRLATAEEQLQAELDLTEERLTEALGEETARVLSSARQAAADIRGKAEENTARMVREAAESAEATRRQAEEAARTVRDEAAAERADAERWATETRTAAEAWATETRTAAEEAATEARTAADQRAADTVAEAETAARALREEAEAEHQRRVSEADAEAARLRSEAEEVMGHRRAEADAEAETILEGARAEGRDMVAEAQRVRERVLRDLSRRKKSAKVQLEGLRAGRERLLEAYEVVRRTVEEATGDLNAAIPEARIAADSAARRGEAEAEDSVDALEAELAAARDVDLPIVAPDGLTGEEADRTGATEPRFDEEAETEAEAEAETEVDAELSEAPDDEPTDQVPVVPVPEPSTAAWDQATGEDPFAEAEGDTAVEADTAVETEGGTAVEAEAAPGAPGERAIEDDAREAGEEQTGEEQAEEEQTGPTEEAAAVGEDGDGALGSAASGDDGADALFARIREEQAAFSGASGPEETTSPPDSEDAPAALDSASAGDPAIPGEPPAVGEGVVSLLEQRDGAVAVIERDLGRRIKRALADEENEVLDAIRRSRSRPEVTEVLPAREAHSAAYRDAAGPELRRAFSAGVAFAGTDLSPDIEVGEVAGTLADELCLPLRSRVERCAEESDDLEDLTDRVRSCYREWKRERVGDLVAHAALAAFSVGQFAALPESARVRWVIDDSGRPCPDAEDNALAGTLARGEAFPTGHRCPPAHAGCRCLVVAHVPEPATEVS